MAPKTIAKITAKTIGQKRSDEVKKKMSDAQKNHTVSEEQRAKLRAANLRNGVKVRCVDTGEVFDTKRDAARKYGLTRQSLTASLKNGWKFAGMTWELI